MSLRRAAQSRLIRFARDEGGAVTVEALLWIPFFFLILIIITDTSLAFYGKAQAFRIMQNGNRALAVRRFDSEEQVMDWISASYDSISPDASVETWVSGGVVYSKMEIPIAQLMLFDSLPFFGDGEMVVQTQHYLE